MSQFENSLFALDYLLERVGADTIRSVVGEQVIAWQNRGQSNWFKHSRTAYSGHSEWIINSENGDQVSPVQQVWANRLMEKFLYVLAETGGEPHDNRLSQKTLNSVTAHRSLLGSAFFPARPSVRRNPPPGDPLRTTTCRSCSKTRCTELELQAFIARDVLDDFLHAAFARNTLNELIDQVLDGSLEKLTEMRALALTAARRAGIEVAEAGANREACSACGSKETEARFWLLKIEPEFLFTPVDYPVRNDGLQQETGKTNDTSSGRSLTVRLWGCAVALVAVALLIGLTRHLATRGMPDASGSVRANWGMLLLIGLPAVLLFLACLQTVSGRWIAVWIKDFGRHSIAGQVKTVLVALAATITLVSIVALTV